MATSATIGNLRITTLVDLTPPPRDVSMIYPDVPANDWGPYQDFALESGMWQTQFCGFLVRPMNGDGPIVLVDTGMGPGPHDPGDVPGQLLEELAGGGVEPGDISAVVTTHPHGDHVGWNVSYDGDTPRATFPNARYMIARADWDHWTSDDVAPNVPAIGRSVQPLEGLGVLHLVDGEEDVAPGVKTRPANGHTPGHQVVMIESGGETGVIIGDLFHNVAQVTETEWCPMFDWNQDMARAARREILGAAASGGWTVFAGHLRVGSNIGKVSGSGDRFTWQSI
ncbi:MAG: MBL fold metallo-hydrolase [Dehalococcoidia bacterium]|nr:MBL fold metallo-hydrolase [Dehalococcoidia bacterium]